MRHRDDSIYIPFSLNVERQFVGDCDNEETFFSPADRIRIASSLLDTISCKASSTAMVSKASAQQIEFKNATLIADGKQLGILLAAFPPHDDSKLDMIVVS